jgi:hypothetical protein
MKKMLLLFWLFITFWTIAQEKMMTRAGIINFEASVPFLEEVKAKNEEVSAILTTKANDFSCVTKIRNFHFKMGLMEEHFNKNYLESSRYPKASFKGKIEKFDLKDITFSAKEYQLKGKLEIHGKSKKIIVWAKIRKVEKGIELISNFTVNTDDYGIQIPPMVRSKIAQNAKIEIKCILN